MCGIGLHIGDNLTEGFLIGQPLEGLGRFLCGLDRFRRCTLTLCSGDGGFGGAQGDDRLRELRQECLSGRIAFVGGFLDLTQLRFPERQFCHTDTGRIARGARRNQRIVRVGDRRFCLLGRNDHGFLKECGIAAIELLQGGLEVRLGRGSSQRLMLLPAGGGESFSAARFPLNGVDQPRQPGKIHGREPTLRQIALQTADVGRQSDNFGRQRQARRLQRSRHTVDRRLSGRELRHSGGRVRNCI